MNPNLPVGGSAFDVTTTEAPVEGLTVFGLSYGFGYFGSHFAGSDSIDPVRTEEITAHVFDLNLEHHFGGGFSAGVRVPIGSVRVDPVAAAPTFVSGFGDLQLGGALELGRFWGTGGYKPSVKIRPSLILPTGETRRTADPGDDAPPNLIALGSGAIGLGLEIQGSKYVAREWALRARLGARSPLSFNEADLRFGAVFSGAAGGLFRARKRVFVTADASILHRRSSRERTMGELVNSGGTWLTADLGVSVVPRDKIVVGASLRVPLFRDVNGEQISQTFGLNAFVALSFGGEKKDKHDHEGEDKHDHEGGDKHDHEGGDKHDHEGEDKHDGEDKHEGEDKHDHEGDIGHLAKGGASFDFAAARVPGKVVVLDFWAEWCHPCKAITALLEKRAAASDKLAVRKVEVPTFDTPVARRYLPGVKGLPVVWIVGADGKVVDKLVQVTPAALDRALDKIIGPGESP